MPPRLHKLVPFLLATLGGVLYFVGYVGFDQWYLEWIAFAPLFVALDGAPTGRRALLLSWWFGFVTHLGGFYWIVHLLQTFAAFPLPLAVAGLGGLGLIQGLMFGVAGLAAWKLKRRTGWSIGWTGALGLVAAEFAYPLIFPFYTANSQAWVPLLTQVADLGGVLLLTGLIALAGGAVAELVLARLRGRPASRALLATAALSLIFTPIYGAVRIRQIDARDAAAPKLKVAIIQANVGAGDKHLRVDEGIRRFREMTDAAFAEHPDLGLVAWPESGFNKMVVSGANLTGKVATEVKSPMLVGALRGERGDQGRLKVWNSILAVAPGGEVVDAYDKVKLLVFGESLPGYETFPGFYEWMLKQGLLPYLSVYTRGTHFAPLPVGPYRFSADVCYEDILPRHIRALMAAGPGGARPHAMFNATNDSWYGPVEPRIHLALATFRSIEHRRWLVRSTATGISAFVDSSGRLAQQSGFEQAETLVHEVPMIEGGPTVYAAIGDVLGWLALALCVAAFLPWPWRRRGGPAQAA